MPPERFELSTTGFEVQARFPSSKMANISLDAHRITVDDHLLSWMEAFMLDRRAAGLSEGSLFFYRSKLIVFAEFCDSQALTNISQITPNLIRRFILLLKETGHNQGGLHAFYRSLRALLYWYEQEAEPDGWKNPIRKVKAPRVGLEPLEPVPLNDITRMIKTCERDTFSGDRDAAILLCLLDTGARAREFLSINLSDVNQVRGDLLIRKGKGGKPRSCYLGRSARRSLRRYLKHRQDNNNALWVTQTFERLTYSGLRSILRRRSFDAHVPLPTLHSFRRAFALSMLRAGTDVFTLSRLMGHAGIQVLQRYLKQTDQDAEAAHRRNSPADGL